MPKKKTYSLAALSLSEFGEAFQAQDAHEDVLALVRLLLKGNIEVRQSAITTSSVLSVTQFEAKCKNRPSSFLELTRSKVLSKALDQRAAESGLLFQRLELAYKLDTETGIGNLLKEKLPNSRKSRVTASKKVIASISNFFSAKR